MTIMKNPSLSTFLSHKTYVCNRENTFLNQSLRKRTPWLRDFLHLRCNRPKVPFGAEFITRGSLRIAVNAETIVVGWQSARCTWHRMEKQKKESREEKRFGRRFEGSKKIDPAYQITNINHHYTGSQLPECSHYARYDSIQFSI